MRHGQSSHPYEMCPEKRWQSPSQDGVQSISGSHMHETRPEKQLQLLARNVYKVAVTCMRCVQSSSHLYEMCPE